MRIAARYDYQSAASEIYGGQLMKKILISVVLALTLAGTSAFAAQSKPAPKPAAAATSNPGTMKSSSTSKKKHKKRHHKKKGASTTSKMANKNK